MNDSVPPREVLPVNFRNVIYLLTVPVIYDIIPIGGLFLFHKHNFTINNNVILKTPKK